MRRPSGTCAIHGPQSQARSREGAWESIEFLCALPDDARAGRVWGASDCISPRWGATACDHLRRARFALDSYEQRSCIASAGRLAKVDVEGSSPFARPSFQA